MFHITLQPDKDICYNPIPKEGFAAAEGQVAGI